MLLPGDYGDDPEIPMMTSMKMGKMVSGVEKLSFHEADSFGLAFKRISNQLIMRKEF